MANTPTRWTALRRLRLPAVVILGSALPLLLFLYFGDHLLRKAAIGNLSRQSAGASDMVAQIIEERLATARAAVQSLAAEPDLEDAWKRRDTGRLSAHLREAHDLVPVVAFWALYDRDGFLQADYPQNTQEAGRNFSAASWFQNVVRQRAVYVSGAAPVGSSHEWGITVAAPVGYGQPDGVLTATYDLRTIKTWLAALPPSATNWISIVDPNGFMVVPPGLDPSAAPHDASAAEEVKKMLAGRSGTEFVRQGRERALVTTHPFPSWHGGVLVEIPAAEIDKDFWQLERPIALVGALFAVFALIVGSGFAWLYRRLKTSQEYTRRIISDATDAFVAIDDHGNITNWNPKAESLFGWPAAEVIGKPLHATIIPERYREAHLRGMERFHATGEGPVLNQSLELAALDRSGREFTVELSIAHLRGPGKSSFNAFLRDISERKRTQHEIARLNTELERRISDLEARNGELEAFSYSVSHDVRAPLRHMEGFTQLLSDECGPQLSDAGRQYLEQAQNAARHMHRLVDDLLRFARLGEQGLKLQKTDLGELAREVTSSLHRDLGNRKIKFELASLPTVACDRSLVRQVFWNLLSNAVKFTSIRDEALISVGHYAQEGQVVLFVRDNGVGFNMKYADKLFAPFQRLHTQDQFEGTGVGLAIVQRIVLKHGGRIWAEAEPDHGASFFFSLPVVQTATSEVLPVPALATRMLR